MIDKMLNKIVVEKLRAMKSKYEARLATVEDETEKLKISLALQIIDDALREYEEVG